MLGDALIQPMVGTARADVAKLFYSDTLGLKLKHEDAFAMVFAIGDRELRVNRVPAVVPSTYAILGFHVKDIADIADRLEQKAVIMERFPFLPADARGIWKAPDGTQVAWFRDPDGNLLSIVQLP